MSFSSDNRVIVHAPVDVCYDVLSDPELFEDFMVHDITTKVSIKARDEVYIDDDLNIIEASAEDEASKDEVAMEKCPRINFELTETVVYLGIAKEVVVVGHVVMSASRRLHIDHRSASDGLVVTDKIRRFGSLSPSLPLQTSASLGVIDDDSLTGSELDDLVVDADPTEHESSVDSTDILSSSLSLPASSPSAHVTEIVETLTGVTTWYLKYFTEMEARRSHKAFMERYNEFVLSRRSE